MCMCVYVLVYVYKLHKAEGNPISQIVHRSPSVFRICFEVLSDQQKFKLRQNQKKKSSAKSDNAKVFLHSKKIA